MSWIDDLYRRGVISRKPTDEERALFNDLHAYGDVESHQRMQWIASAVSLARRVARESSPEETALFWVRACGVVVDLRAEHAASVAKLRVGLQHLFTDPAAAPLVSKYETLARAFDAAVDVLADDEKIYLEYRRHVECHPLQSGYRVRRGKKGAIVQEVKSNLLGRNLPHQESQEMLRRVLLRHAIDEPAIARHFAARLEPRLSAIEVAARPLYT